jgi:hypothetical protein
VRASVSLKKRITASPRWAIPGRHGGPLSAVGLDEAPERSPRAKRYPRGELVTFTSPISARNVGEAR